VDDIADTCGTVSFRIFKIKTEAPLLQDIFILRIGLTLHFLQLAKAAITVKEHGAKEVFIVVTQGILSASAENTINESYFSGLVVTNSMFSRPHYSH
jgi:hypothetical protein